MQIISVKGSNFIPVLDRKITETDTAPSLEKGQYKRVYREPEKIAALRSEGGVTLKFVKDNISNQIVIEMVDSETGEAIRQIPSKVSLKLAAYFGNLRGRFVNEFK